MQSIVNLMAPVLSRYQASFSAKDIPENIGSSDVLMDVFGISPERKVSSIQYWNRELGMCWEKLVAGVFQARLADYGPALPSDFGVPCDFTAGDQAFDTKYRLGSGDSGTLRRLAENAAWLRSKGYQPVMLLLRDDNLDAAISKMNRGGWQVLQGAETFEFILGTTGIDLHGHLLASKGAWQLTPATAA